MKSNKFYIFCTFVITVFFTLCGANAASAADMIDVSSYQTGINVTTTGAQIVVSKATEGVGYVNPDCDRVVQSALNAGQGVGVYDFANTNNNPISEANFFVDNTVNYFSLGVVPILDWEPSQRWNVNWALQWLNRVEARTGIKPIIYMNQSTENSFDWSSVVSQNYGLWIAAYTLGYTPIYGFNPPSAEPVLRNWPFAVAWQFTSTGYVNEWGSAVDLSVMYGDLETWYKYANKNSAPTISQPVQTVNNSCVVIGSGDTLSGIAERTGLLPYVNWSGFSSGNPNIIYAGEIVCYNSSQNVSKNGHVVQSGETLWSIFGTDWVTAASRNGLSNPNLIYAGQILY